MMKIMKASKKDRFAPGSHQKLGTALHCSKSFTDLQVSLLAVIQAWSLAGINDNLDKAIE